MASESKAYRSLDVVKVIGTISVLKKRVQDRFPNSGLASVCTDLKNLADDSRTKIEWISKPNIWIRIGIALLILSARFARSRTDKSARELYFASIIYLPLIWAVMVLDH